MYRGKFDCRVTTRCSYCGYVTIKELNIVKELDTLGKVKAEVIPGFICGRCKEMAFRESRIEVEKVEVQKGVGELINEKILQPVLQFLGIGNG